MPQPVSSFLLSTARRISSACGPSKKTVLLGESDWNGAARRRFGSGHSCGAGTSACADEWEPTGFPASPGNAIHLALYGAKHYTVQQEKNGVARCRTLGIELAKNAQRQNGVRGPTRPPRGADTAD